jgi:hypothetical protein
MSDMRDTRQAPRTIVVAGLVAGTLDLAAALLVYGARGARPTAILQAIASGALGRAAFQGGLATAALGVGFHFLIATTAAAVYYVASRRLPVLTRRPLPYGALYGVAVWLVMNLVVIPLSAVTPRPFDPALAFIIVLVHVVCVGVPIALVVRHGDHRFARVKTAADPATDGRPAR